MTEAPRKLMRKPRTCDGTGCAAPWPALGVGCPTSWADQPPALRGVYLWHCGAPACATDCAARFAAQLRKHGRSDLADRLAPQPRTIRPAAPRGDALQPSLL